MQVHALARVPARPVPPWARFTCSTYYNTYILVTVSIRILYVQAVRRAEAQTAHPRYGHITPPRPTAMLTDYEAACLYGGGSDNIPGYRSPQGTRGSGQGREKNQRGLKLERYKRKGEEKGAAGSTVRKKKKEDDKKDSPTKSVKLSVPEDDAGAKKSTRTMLCKVSDDTFARAAEARGYELDHKFLLGIPDAVFEAEAARRGFKRKHE